MKNLFFLALAGSMGAITRHLLFLLFAKITYIKFPLGTMFVNVLGSFLIGVAYVYISSKPHLSETLKLIIVIGFLGSFTTFSTFTYDIIQLFNRGSLIYPSVCIFLSIFLSLIAFVIGIKIIQYFI